MWQWVNVGLNPSGELTKDVVLELILEEARLRFGGLIAEKAIIPLIYSGILSKMIEFERSLRIRLRFNILLSWPAGWFKTSVLQSVMEWFGDSIVARNTTATTGAAMRGSVVQGKYFPPEFLINNVVAFFELSSVMADDDATIGQMLSLLEEGEIGVAVVKAGGLETSEIRRLEKYGARYEDFRIYFRARAACWSATHTLESIPLKHRDAFLDRFFVIDIPKITMDIETLCLGAQFDAARTAEIQTELKSIIRGDLTPDLGFVASAMKILGKRLKSQNVEMAPRHIGDIRRMLIAHHAIMPTDPEEIALNYVTKFVPFEIPKTTRELITEFIWMSPKTIPEICEFANTSKSNALNHLKRMGVRGRPGKKYTDLNTYEAR